MAQRPTLQSNLIHIAWALNIYRLATNIVGVFIPLIILTNGGKLQTIALFYVLYAVVKLCFNYTCMRLIQKRGAHFGLGAGFGFSALQLASVLGYAHAHTTVLLAIAAIGFALTNGFLWNAQHFYISQQLDAARQSSNIALIEVYGRLTDIAGPLIGGVVGTLFGSEWLLVVALTCLAGAFIPLQKMRRQTEDTESLPARFSYTLSGAPAGDVLANFSCNIEVLVGRMVWPVYLAVFFGNYKAIGGVITLAALASIVTTSVAGHRGDKGKDRQVLKQGIFSLSLIDIARVAASAGALITLVGAAYEAALAYFGNAWMSTYYHHAKGKGVQYIVSMEIACDLAYSCFWGLFYTLSLFVHSNRMLFNIAFLVAAAAAWGCLLMSKQRAQKAYEATLW